MIESNGGAPGRSDSARTVIGISSDEIDGGFVPEARSDVAVVHVGGEIVLGRIADGTTCLQTCALNETGSIVWQCFDGSGTVDEISADIAEVFGADIEAVSADVTALARQVGGAGFLVGVHDEVFEIGGDPPGLAVGVPFPDFEGDEEDGRTFRATQLLGHRTLLVSWSPTCAFCARIASDLADLVPGLTDVGVELVVLATGEVQATRASLDGGDLTARLVFQRGDGAEGFAGLGTPVAYLVNENGAVAEPVALGAVEVVALARRILVAETP